MSALRRWRILLTHPHADVRFGPAVYIGPGFSLHLPGRGSFIVGPNVEFRRNFRAEVGGEGRITIGEGASFTWDVTLQCTQSIEIGTGCVVATGATVVDGQHRFRDLSKSVLDQGYRWHPIAIGDGAWVTSKCTVMANVGERAVIGANSAVTEDIPPFTIASGVPARVIEYFGPPGKQPPGLEHLARPLPRT